jgi:hypothetical protein
MRADAVCSERQTRDWNRPANEHALRLASVHGPKKTMKSFAPALTPVTASPRTGTGRLRVDVDPHVVSPAGNGIHDCRVMDMILGFFWCRNKATVSGRHRENLYKSLLKTLPFRTAAARICYQIGSNFVIRDTSRGLAVQFRVARISHRPNRFSSARREK